MSGVGGEWVSLQGMKWNREEVDISPQFRERMKNVP